MRAPSPRSIVLRAALVAGLSTVALAGCERSQPRSAAPAAAAVQAVAKGVVDVEGGLIRITAPRDGVVGQVKVHEGDTVAKGAVLAVLDEAQARLNADAAAAEEGDKRAQAAIAETKAAAAAREAARLARLSKADAATRQDADQAQTAAKIAAGERDQAAEAVKAAEVRRKLAALDLEARTVRAPAAGVVLRRFVSAGASVSTSTPTPLFAIAPDAPRIIRAELDEAFADRVKPGMAASVTREFNERRTYKAKVLRVSEMFGAAALNDEPGSRADARVLSVVLEVEPADGLRLGQRVLVRFEP